MRDPPHSQKEGHKERRLLPAQAEGKRRFVTMARHDEPKWEPDGAKLPIKPTPTRKKETHLPGYCFTVIGNNTPPLELLFG
jgi:hypothetical protein